MNICLPPELHPLVMLITAGRVLGVGFVFGAGIPIFYALGTKSYQYYLQHKTSSSPECAPIKILALSATIFIFLLVVSIISAGVFFLALPTLKYYFG